MSAPLHSPSRCIALPLYAALLLAVVSAWAHEVDCSAKKGLDLARCQRHVKMAGRCEPVKGDAHYACDREFMIANPLACSALEGADQAQCQAEGAALKSCEPKPGREFMRCVSNAIKTSPS